MNWGGCKSFPPKKLQKQTF